MSICEYEQTEELQMAIALMREELMGVVERALMTSSINEARERQQLDARRLGQHACAHHGASPSPQVRAQLDALRLGQQAASREVAISRQEASDLRAELEQTQQRRSRPKGHVPHRGGDGDGQATALGGRGVRVAPNAPIRWRSARRLHSRARRLHSRARRLHSRARRLHKASSTRCGRSRSTRPSRSWRSGARAA